MAIVTAAEAKAQLNMSASDTSQDTELTAFIAAATEVVEHIVGPVEAREVVEVHDGGLEALVLLETPVLSVTAVTEGGVTVPSSGYVLSSSAGVLYRTPNVWLSGRNTVTVTYQAGRAAVPASIRQAVLELVAVNFRSQQGGNYSPFDSGGDTNTGGDVILGFFVPNRVMQLLAPHRQHGGIA